MKNLIVEDFPNIWKGNQRQGQESAGTKVMTCQFPLLLIGWETGASF